MTIRLSKACRELNIGITIALEFLNNHGYDIPFDPNYKLEDELYFMLNNEFKDNLPLNRNEISENIKSVVGKIDLDLLRQKTLKKKEFNSDKRIKISSSYENNKSNQLYLQEIWQKFTDVQEQMIRLRSVPISIIPDSAKIIGEKLYLTANEDNITDTIINEITSTFDLSPNEINIEVGYFFADVRTAQEIRQEDKNLISERAAANFINFQPLPIVDGFVNKKESPIMELHNLLKQFKLDYDFDKKGRLQISIIDLIKLIELSNTDLKKIKIPEIATIILPISPNLKHFITKCYPYILSKNSENVKIGRASCRVRV